MFADLTKETRALAGLLRAEAGLKGPRSRCRYGLMPMLGAIAGREGSPLSSEVQQALYGISDAYGSGRMSVMRADQWAIMADWRKCLLIADVATHCRVSGEVAAYLAKRMPQIQL